MKEAITVGEAEIFSLNVLGATFLYWEQRLSSDPHFEFGDSFSFVNEMIDHLKKIDHFLKIVASLFKIEVVGLASANHYFLLNRKINDWKEYAQTVKGSNQGSRQKTYECIKIIEACQDALRRVDSLLTEEQKTEVVNLLALPAPKL